jgi:hypothetical protein
VDAKVDGFDENDTPELKVAPIALVRAILKTVLPEPA